MSIRNDKERPTLLDRLLDVLVDIFPFIAGIIPASLHTDHVRGVLKEAEDARHKLEWVAFGEFNSNPARNIDVSFDSATGKVVIIDRDKQSHSIPVAEHRFACSRCTESAGVVRLFGTASGALILATTFTGDQWRRVVPGSFEHFRRAILSGDAGLCIRLIWSWCHTFVRRAKNASVARTGTGGSYSICRTIGPWRRTENVAHAPRAIHAGWRTDSAPVSGFRFLVCGVRSSSVHPRMKKPKTTNRKPKTQNYTGNSSCCHAGPSSFGGAVKSRSNCSSTSRLLGGLERIAKSARATRRRARVSSRRDL